VGLNTILLCRSSPWFLSTSIPGSVISTCGNKDGEEGERVLLKGDKRREDGKEG